MNLYLLSQSDNTGYDTYDSCVVIARNERDAQRIHPRAEQAAAILQYMNGDWEKDAKYGPWADAVANVTVEYLGKAERGREPGVICASFNAG